MVKVGDSDSLNVFPQIRGGLSNGRLRGSAKRTMYSPRKRGYRE